MLHPGIALGLDFVFTDTRSPNPAELLMSDPEQDILKSMSAHYDVVLVDTPHVLAMSDTAILVPNAGTTFLVVCADVS